MTSGKQNIRNLTVSKFIKAIVDLFAVPQEFAKAKWLQGNVNLSFEINMSSSKAPMPTKEVYHVQVNNLGTF